MNSFTLPHRPINATRAFVSELRSKAPELLRLANFSGFDEFSGPFEQIADDFLPLRQEFPNISTLTTAHLGSQYDSSLVPSPVPFTPEALHGLGVTAVVPQTNWLPPAANVTRVQRAGIAVWTYISMQPYTPLACRRCRRPRRRACAAR